MRYCLLILILMFTHFSSTAAIFVLKIPTRVTDESKKYLAADLYTSDTNSAKPVIFIQTPYNKDLFRIIDSLPPQAGGSLLFDTSAYNYVVLDWRGFYSSKCASIADYDRGLDGYDAIEWIALQKWCNGKIGTWGASALGLIQYQTARHKPPHLICAVPIVKDYQTKYSDFFYGGDFRKEHVETLEKLGFTTVDFILKHYKHDNVWRITENNTDYPEDINIPLLVIGGWFDHYPADVIRSFNDLRDRSNPLVRNKHKLIMGPWLHTEVGKLKQGILEFPEAVDFPQQEARKFFDYYLHDAKINWEGISSVRYFQMGENVWKSTDDWRKISRQYDTLYLRKDHELSTVPPPPQMSPVPQPPDTILYNPKNPSPTVGGSRFNLDPRTPVGPQDISQSVENRNDILVYSTEMLDHAFIVDGQIIANLLISSDREDTDFSIRLCDVYPDGRSVILTQGIHRLRFRHGYDTEELLQPGTIDTISITLHDIAYTFKQGHRIRIDITGSDYPMFDINLNNGGELYKPGDTLAATNLVYCNAEHKSEIIFPIGSITSVNEPEKLDSSMIQIYPNPSREIISILTSGYILHNPTIKIFDETCCDVSKLCPLKFNEKMDQFQLDIANLTSGIYLLQIIDQGNIFTKKFIRTR